MHSLKIEAHAKINLSLDVTGRRSDGYHLVRMVMQSLTLHDTLTFEKKEAPGIVLTCDRPGVPTDNKNLVWKAADLLIRKYNLADGLRVHINKKIPAAAGLAGGSSDAAAALKAVNTLFGLDLPLETLCSIGVQIGADVPYCLLGGTALAEGIGEILTPLPALPACSIILAKPKADVATGSVYHALDDMPAYPHPDVDGQVEAIKKGDLPEVIRKTGNVLELVTAPRLPEIGKLETFLLANGAAGACMSGSGPTVFGIFYNKEKAESALHHLSESGFSGERILTAPVS